MSACQFETNWFKKSKCYAVFDYANPGRSRSGSYWCVWSLTYADHSGKAGKVAKRRNPGDSELRSLNLGIKDTTISGFSSGGIMSLLTLNSMAPDLKGAGAVSASMLAS